MCVPCKSRHPPSVRGRFFDGGEVASPLAWCPAASTRSSVSGLKRRSHVEKLRHLAAFAFSLCFSSSAFSLDFLFLGGCC